MICYPASSKFEGTRIRSFMPVVIRTACERLSIVAKSIDPSCHDRKTNTIGVLHVLTFYHGNISPYDAVGPGETLPGSHRTCRHNDVRKILLVVVPIPMCVKLNALLPHERLCLVAGGKDLKYRASVGMLVSIAFVQPIYFLFTNREQRD